MKLKTLIKRLQKLEAKHKTVDVIVDFDEHGYFNLEKVKVVKDKETKKVMINLQSSNET